MLRRGLGVLAVLAVVAGGQARADGWPGVPVRGGGGGCASCGSGAVGGWTDESPLYPELTHWTFEKSNCRRLHGQGHRRNDCEVQYFPPLPYGRGPVYSGQAVPATSAAPAAPAAAAPAPPAVPAASPAPPAAPAAPATPAATPPPVGNSPFEPGF